MTTLRIPAPAKVNLILRILRKRRDGYHDLCSLFHRISLSDEIAFRQKKSPGLKLVFRGKRLPQGRHNLVGKAYEMLCQRIHKRPGLEVRLTKRIPVGAGLGGGSSDAASFLLGANRILKLGFSQTALCRLGGRIGSDVPFFIKDTAFALCEGRGEKLKSIPCKTRYFFVIAAFRTGFSTKEMYRKLTRKYRQPVSLTTVRANARICADLWNHTRLKEASRFFHNDFLPIAREKLGRISQVIDTWRRRDIPCLMSGSGSSIFAVFKNKSKALEEAKRLKKRRGIRVFVAESFRHSIHAKIKEE